MGPLNQLWYQQEEDVPESGPVQKVTAAFKLPALILVITIGVLTACGQAETSLPAGAAPRAETVELPTSQPTTAPSPVSTRVLPLETYMPVPTTPLTPTITPIPDEARGLVVQVIDGDTVGVVMEGDPPSRVYLVKYIGVDAPPNTPDEPWGVVAYETNRKMTNLKVARLVRDQTNFDDEGRLLRYVYVGDKLMSIVLAEQGLVRADSVEPNTRFAGDIQEAETQARNGRLGLWGPPPTPTPGQPQPTVPGETPGATVTGTVTVAPEASAVTPTEASPNETETAPTTEATVKNISATPR
jgi:endonuclease YncB( thermonuclease family)